MKITPWLMKTSSSIETPVQMKAWLGSCSWRRPARALLNLDEGPDAGVVADLAAVQIRERVDDNVLTERHVVDQTVGRVVGGPPAILRRSLAAYVLRSVVD
jgi:hypothetical protein